MSRDTATDRLHGVRTMIVRVVREETGLHERLALPVADSIVRGLQRELAGTSLQIPTYSPEERAAAIRDARDSGLGPSEISRTFNVSRATVYRALGLSSRDGGE